MKKAGDSSIAEAYEYCKELTSRRESNFSLGFSVLPPARKRAIYVVYAFCRFVDDVSDESGPADATKLLDAWRKEIDRVYVDGESTHPIGQALLDVLKTFKVPREGFEELIEGCIIDQRTKTYATFKDLTRYCDLVATSIAKVSLPVYGFRMHPAVIKHGRDLSFAFQLTNILRDIAEDAERGRVYTPADELKKAGLTVQDVVQKKDLKKLTAFYAEQGRRCEEYFQSGAKVIEYLDSESRPCVRVMWGAYHKLLDKILADPPRSLEARTVLTEDEKRAIIDEGCNERNGK